MQSSFKILTYLCNSHDIRPNTGILNGEVLPCPQETGLYLVDNQQNSVPITYLSQSPHVLRRRRHVAAFTDDRLDDDGGRVLGRALLLEEQLQLVETVS